MSMTYCQCCGTCIYGVAEGSTETMCDYLGKEGRTRLKQVYELLGVDRLTAEAREMMSPQGCVFYRWSGATPRKKAESIELDWNKAAELYEQGKTTREIAEALGARSVGRIYEWQRLTGRKPNGRKVFKVDRDELRRLHREGYTDAELAEKCGCSKETARHIRKELGLEYNRREQRRNG